jgi:hypothetical protein
VHVPASHIDCCCVLTRHGSLHLSHQSSIKFKAERRSRRRASVPRAVIPSRRESQDLHGTRIRNLASSLPCISRVCCGCLQPKTAYQNIAAESVATGRHYWMSYMAPHPSTSQGSQASFVSGKEPGAGGGISKCIAGAEHLEIKTNGLVLLGTVQGKLVQYRCWHM